ncbi:MAG: MBG domain-containing protein, partial [Bacillota bacterium]
KINVNKLELHTEDYSDEYDAQSHYGVAYATLDGKTKLTDAVLEYSTDNGETWTTEAPSAKNVADSCTVLVRANYESFTQVEGSYKLTITPAPLTITAKDQTYEYNGGPQGEDGSAYASDADITKKVEAAGLKGQDELTSITLNGQETNAKEYAGKIVPSAAEVGEATDNYTIEYVAGKLTITPASATITANDKTKTYGDADPELTATEDGILEGDSINYKLKRETGENVKGSPYAITFEYEGRKSSKIFSFRPFSKSNTVTLGNYEVTFVDGELTIEPAEIIIKTPSKEKTYDGSPLTAKGSIKGLVNGETVTFTTTGKQTEVGSSENTYSLKWDGTAKKSNYTITEKLGTLTVTEAAGEDDDEEDDDTDEPGGDNPGGGNPEGGNPGGNGDGNGTIVTADNDIPDSAAPTTLIDDNAAPRAGNGSWALINLIAAILTAIGAIVAFFRRKQEEDEQETDKVDENDGDEADTRGRKMLAAKLGGVVTAIVSIIVFFLTEDMTLPMILVDKWTLLMIIFFAFQILTAILNKRASKDDDDEEDDGPAPETA